MINSSHWLRLHRVVTMHNVDLVRAFPYTCTTTWPSFKLIDLAQTHRQTDMYVPKAEPRMTETLNPKSQIVSLSSERLDTSYKYHHNVTGMLSQVHTLKKLHGRQLIFAQATAVPSAHGVDNNLNCVGPRQRYTVNK